MFRASETEPQMSLFDNPSNMMCKRASKKYEGPKAWQNQFYRMVTLEIDESLFQPLFKEGRMGALEPLTAVLIGLLVFGEPFSVYLAVGIVLILAAVVIIAMSQQKKHTYKVTDIKTKT